MSKVGSWISKERNNLLVYLIVGFVMLVTGPTNQFFTIYQRDIGMDLAVVGIIAAAAAMFDMLARFSAGVLSDRKGRRRPLLFLVVASVFYPFLLIYFDSMTALLVIKILHSVVNAAFWTVLVAYLFDTNPKDRGGKVYSQVLIALFVANLLSPVIGGFIIDAWGYHWLFSLSCYLAIIPIVLVFFLKKPHMKRQRLSVKGEVSDILEKPRFIKVWTVMLLVSFTASFIGTFFPIYLYEMVGLSHTQVGLFFSAGTLVLLLVQPFLGWLADRFRSKIIIPANMVLMTIGLFLLSVVSGIGAIFITKSMTIIGIFGGRVKGGANVAKMTPNEEHALAQAMFKSASGVGWTTMNAISPLLIAAIGYTGVFRMLAVISGLAGLWYWFAYGSKEKPEHEGFLYHLRHHHAFSLTDSNPLERYRHK